MKLFKKRIKIEHAEAHRNQIKNINIPSIVKVSNVLETKLGMPEAEGSRSSLETLRKPRLSKSLFN